MDRTKFWYPGGTLKIAKIRDFKEKYHLSGPRAQTMAFIKKILSANLFLIVYWTKHLSMTNLSDKKLLSYRTSNAFQPVKLKFAVFEQNLIF